MIRLATLLLLAFSLTAQPADYRVRIEGTPYDTTPRSTALLEVETITPLADPERITLTIFATNAEAETITPSGMTCSQPYPGELACAVAPMAAGEKATLHLAFRPRFSYLRSTINAQIEWKERGHRAEKRFRTKTLISGVRELTVTNGDDSGPGSLRQALLDANATCIVDACRLRFDLAPGTNIRPLTALPRILARDLVIDGESRVAIDGSLTAGANGLEIGDQASVVIRGLKVHSFPYVGIEVKPRSSATIEHCQIVNNGSRGITVLNAFRVDIFENLLSGNGRSGVWIDNGGARILDNLIGVAADGVTPMPNLASGIFASGSGDTYIAHNVIAHNAHFGVAIPIQTRDVEVGPNRIFANRAGQIDLGLDGPSFFPFVQFGAGPNNGPSITSATYDAATNATTIRGRLDNAEFFYFLRYELQFFATTPANEADQFLGAILITQPDFVFTVRGDLRGRYVTGNTIRWSDTDFGNIRGASELGAPIAVQ